MSFGRIVGRALLIWACLGVGCLSATLRERFPAPDYPSAANRLRWAGTVSLLVSVRNGRPQGLETKSYDFYESRIPAGGDRPVRRSLKGVYPGFFSEPVARIVRDWRFEQRSFDFQVDFVFELADRDDESHSWQCVRIEAQTLAGQIQAPRKIVVTAGREGPDYHRDP